jgi:outer membrane protein assembly factor BamD
LTQSLQTAQDGRPAIQIAGRPAPAFARARRGLAAALAAGLLLAGCAGPRSTFVIPPGAGDALTPARAALAGGNETSAILKLTEYLKDNPGAALVDEANYLLGYANLAQGSRVLAADSFQRVLQDYPQSRFSAEACYQLAVSYDGLARPSQLDQDWTQKAIGAYQGFITRYPERPEVSKAQERIRVLEDRLARKEYENGVLYLKMRAPEAARLYFQMVLDDHPQSSFACRASLGLGESLLALRRWAEAADRLQAVADSCSGEPAAQARGFLPRARGMAAATRASIPDSAAAADTVATP